jgi:hypothetical protein
MLPTLFDELPVGADVEQTKLRTLLAYENSSFASFAGDSAQIPLPDGRFLHVLEVQKAGTSTESTEKSLQLESDALTVPSSFAGETGAAAVVVIELPLDTPWGTDAAGSGDILGRVLSVVATDAQLREVEVRGLTQPVVLTFTVKLDLASAINELDVAAGLTRSPTKIVEATVRCMFWDVPNATWSESGCERSGVSPAVADEGVSPESSRTFRVQCACDHLTDFAVRLVNGGPELDLIQSVAEVTKRVFV